jgi:hypothetical protein
MGCKQSEADRRKGGAVSQLHFVSPLQLTIEQHDLSPSAVLIVASHSQLADKNPCGD